MRTDFQLQRSCWKRLVKWWVGAEITLNNMGIIAIPGNLSHLGWSCSAGEWTEMEEMIGLGQEFFKKKEKWLHIVDVALDKITSRRKWEKEAPGQLFSFAGFLFKLKMRAKFDFCILRGVHYTTDLSRAFCLSETYINSSLSICTLFLPFSYSLLFIGFHCSEPCSLIAFPYLSCFQQAFITADTVMNTHVCFVENRIK